MRLSLWDILHTVAAVISYCCCYHQLMTNCKRCLGGAEGHLLRLFSHCAATHPLHAPCRITVPSLLGVLCDMRNATNSHAVACWCFFTCGIPQSLRHKQSCCCSSELRGMWNGAKSHAVARWCLTCCAFANQPCCCVLPLCAAQYQPHEPFPHGHGTTLNVLYTILLTSHALWCCAAPAPRALGALLLGCAAARCQPR